MADIAADGFVDPAAEGALVGIESLRRSSRPGAAPMKRALEILGRHDRRAGE